MPKILHATEYLQTLSEITSRSMADLDFDWARSPSEGLARFAESGDYRLVVVDLAMDDTGKYAADPAVDLSRVGVSLARDIRAINPSVPIVVRTEAYDLNSSQAMRRPLADMCAGMADLFVIWAPWFNAADMVNLSPGFVEDDSFYNDYGWWMDPEFPARQEDDVAGMFGRFFAGLLLAPPPGPICNRLRRFSEGDLDLSR